MKTDLSAEAIEALKVVLEQLKKVNPFIDHRRGILASHLILHYAQQIDDKQLEVIASRLMTPKGRQRALLRHLSHLTGKLDEASTKTLH